MSLIVTSGCSTIRNELRYPGGAPGKLLDERTFDASGSKHLALLRASLALAIAARIWEASVVTEDADVFAKQLAEAANEINYAAVDAGFVYFDANGDRRVTCEIEVGKPRGTDHNYLGNSNYASMDGTCAGYYVNFEANVARIESRIVRATLTALPADKARKFLENLSKGNLVSALWSLTGSLSDLAGAFHRGAGVYRAGLENIAASTEQKKCQWDRTFKAGSSIDEYKQRYDTVRTAAACLGLSEEVLFDSDTIAAEHLPNQLDPKAFFAMFRIVRSSCVALPLQIFPAEQDARMLAERKSRRESCASLRFNPKPRPDSIAIQADGTGTAGNPVATEQTQPRDDASDTEREEQPPAVVPPPG